MRGQTYLLRSKRRNHASRNLYTHLVGLLNGHIEQFQYALNIDVHADTFVSRVGRMGLLGIVSVAKCVSLDRRLSASSIIAVELTNEDEDGMGRDIPPDQNQQTRLQAPSFFFDRFEVLERLQYFGNCDAFLKTL